MGFGGASVGGLPTCPPADLPTCRPADVPTYRPIDLPTFQPSDLPSCRPAEVPTCHLPTCWQVSRARKTPQPWFTGARHENFVGPRNCPSAALQQICEACQTARNDMLSGVPNRTGKFRIDQRSSGETRLCAHEPGRLFHRFGRLVCRPRPLGNPIWDLVNHPAFY